jgi:hypothetical protein
MEKNSTNWFTAPFSVFIASYSNPAIGGNMIHSSSESYYYLYDNIPKFVVQMPPILFVAKTNSARVLPNYIFNNSNHDDSNNTSTVIWKMIYTKIA